MESDIREADVREVLKRHDARYEVRPCYEMFDLHPVGAPAIAQKVQSGFDVDLYGTLLCKSSRTQIRSLSTSDMIFGRK